jgi:hypothetical protein
MRLHGAAQGLAPHRRLHKRHRLRDGAEEAVAHYWTLFTAFNRVSPVWTGGPIYIFSSR